MLLIISAVTSLAFDRGVVCMRNIIKYSPHQISYQLLHACRLSRFLLLFACEFFTRAHTFACLLRKPLSPFVCTYTLSLSSPLSRVVDIVPVGLEVLNVLSRWLLTSFVLLWTNSDDHASTKTQKKSQYFGRSKNECIFTGWIPVQSVETKRKYIYADALSDGRLWP